MQEEKQRLLEARYGARRVNPRRFRYLAIAGITALTAFVISLGLANFSPIQSTTVSFRVLSPWQTQVEFELQMPPGQVASCEFEALNNSFFVVGYVEQSFGPYEQLITRHTVSINTFEEAVTGLVDNCSLR
jgi:hypothetical protein